MRRRAPPTSYSIGGSRSKPAGPRGLGRRRSAWRSGGPPGRPGGRRARATPADPRWPARPRRRRLRPMRVSRRGGGDRLEVRARSCAAASARKATFFGTASMHVTVERGQGDRQHRAGKAGAAADVDQRLPVANSGATARLSRKCSSTTARASVIAVRLIFRFHFCSSARYSASLSTCAPSSGRRARARPKSAALSLPCPSSLRTIPNDAAS